MLRRHRAMLCTGIAAFFAYAYFYQAGGWNQNTRFDLVRALVEHHSILIDDYQDNTGDRALFEGHYYADKAPGASFTAAPVVAVAREIVRGFGANVRAHRTLMWLSYVASLTAAAIPAALTVMILWTLAARLGATETGATIVAFAFALGTPFWAWASVFYGHTLAALCLTSAFAIAWTLVDDPGDARHDWTRGASIGFLIGWAVVTEFPAAIPGGAIALITLGQIWRQDSSRAVRIGAAIALAGGACAVLLGAYHFAAFGSPFHVGYKSEEDATVLKNGFFGFTYPRPDIAGQLLWGSFRGLLPLAPVLLLAPIGWILAGRRSVERRVVLAAGFLFLLGFAMNASYEHWEGGWSFGPRHLGPVLAFLSLGLVPVWMHGGRWLRAAVVTLAICGAAVNLVGVAADAQPANDIARPMAEYLWPSFKDGDISLNRQTYFDKRPPERTDTPRDARTTLAQWNLGERVGLTGWGSLVPLVVVLAFLLVAALRPARSRAA